MSELSVRVDRLILDRLNDEQVVEVAIVLDTLPVAYNVLFMSEIKERILDWDFSFTQMRNILFCIGLEIDRDLRISEAWDWDHVRERGVYWRLYE